MIDVICTRWWVADYAEWDVPRNVQPKHYWLGQFRESYIKSQR